MAVDRYTKAVLTLIALCLVWLSLGGPSVIPAASAQGSNRVILAGWVDENGTVLAFPAAPPRYEMVLGRAQAAVRTSWALPITEAVK